MTLRVIIALSVLQRSICGAGVSRIFMTASPDLLLLPPSLNVMSNFCGLFLNYFLLSTQQFILEPKIKSVPEKLKTKIVVSCFPDKAAGLANN